MSEESEITLVVIRTSDAKKMEIVLPLATKLRELKEDLGTADLFGPVSPDLQRLFFLGRELKSNRSLQKLGLDRFPKNRVLHLHVQKSPPPPPLSSSKTCPKQRTKRQMRSSTQQQQHQQHQQQPKVDNDEILEIDSDSDDDIQLVENPQDNKRRRIS